MLASRLAFGALLGPLVVAARLSAQCPGPAGGQQELEPNAGPAQATPFALWNFEGAFAGVRGAIGAPGDVDYFRFETATPGARLWLVVDTGVGPLGSSRDSVVTVLASDGTTVLEEDDDDGTGNGRNLTIESGEASVIAGLQLSSAGSYYVRVRAKNPADTIARYVLTLGLTTIAPQPEIEPNDDPFTPFPAWGVIQGTLSSAGDVDWYSINLLDFGYPMVVVDADPERDGTSTDVALQIEGFTGTFDTNSSSGNGQPAPGAEGVVLETYGARLRISGTGAGSYRLAVFYSGELCAVPVELQALTID